MVNKRKKINFHVKFVQFLYGSPDSQLNYDFLLCTKHRIKVNNVSFVHRDTQGRTTVYEIDLKLLMIRLGIITLV